MMRALFLLTLGAVWSGASPVVHPPPVVDQAYVVPLPVAKAAVALLRQHAGAWAYCEPCGDAAPVWQPYAEVGIDPWEDGDGAFWVVTLDGAGVDLAYLYVPVGDRGAAANVALLTGMTEVSGVSPVVVAGP